VTRESAGGAANAAGVRNESRWLAWALAHLLSGHRKGVANRAAALEVLAPSAQYDAHAVENALLISPAKKPQAVPRAAHDGGT
jgi:hypothetical protein